MGASCTVHRGSKDREYAAGYRYKYTDPSTEGDSVLIVGQIMNRIPGKEKRKVTVIFNSSYYKEGEQTETVSCDAHGIFKVKLRKFKYCDVDMDVRHPDYRTSFWIGKLGELGKEVRMYITMQAKEREEGEL